jgi:predicted nuclease of predicted toxin-antitoxin system
MARLYSNENFPLPVVEELRRLGHDVLTIQETGKANQAVSDEDVLAFANSKKRILLTLNRRHFIGLHNKRHPHAGILACSFDPDFMAFAARINQVVQEEADFSQKLVRVNRL